MKNSTGKKRKIKVFIKKKKENIDTVIEKLQASYAEVDPKSINKFSDLPLSSNTLKGLTDSEYVTLTEIQKESIFLSLQGNDILGAAKTGSGKTLAFVIPVLETLFCKKWNHVDGVGALIITPIRELAYQIFETLRKVGRYHDFSAALIIGGKDLMFEKKRMDQCNIVICTPGRLLHHMDENPLFDCSNVQILVLDEADRCLDMGFEKTMNSIIENLPSERQTLLFSATQTKSIKDLARLSLTNPKYISVDEFSEYSTPKGLLQSYIVCNLEEKIANLWSFIKSHYKHKILVFFATCKQVKYVFEIFCQLRPGIALLALHGGMHQEKRMKAYDSFCKKEHAVLFATDIAARGLDFPTIHWVIQIDCPENATTYIHRVGRTARFYKGGETVMFLLPSERDAMLTNLTEKKIPLAEIKINSQKIQNPKAKIEAILAKKLDLKASAQRAFVAYLKSVFLMKDKKVFDLNKLQVDQFARSLGLAVTPRIRFLQKMEKSKKGSAKQKIEQTNNILNDKLESALKLEVESDDDEEGVTLKLDAKKNNSARSKKPLTTFNFGGDTSDSNDDDDDDGLLTIKRKDHQLDGVEDEDELDEEVLPEIGSGQSKNKKTLTKVALAKKAIRKNIVLNKKTTFTEDGEVVMDKFKERVTDLGKKYDEESGDEGGINIEEARRILKEEDKVDRKLFRERIKTKHKEAKRKLKNAKKQEMDEEDIEEGVDDWGEEEEDDSGSDRERSSDGSDGSVDGVNDDESDLDATSEQMSVSGDDDHQLSRRPGTTKKKRKRVDEDENQVSSQTLLAAEELALSLIKKRR